LHLSFFFFVYSLIPFTADSPTPSALHDTARTFVLASRAPSIFFPSISFPRVLPSSPRGPFPLNTFSVLIVRFGPLNCVRIPIPPFCHFPRPPSRLMRTSLRDLRALIQFSVVPSPLKGTPFDHLLEQPFRLVDLGARLSLMMPTQG